ncbi:MAG TPA: gephyrin-like molybdotransferase Glp [Solirubrobacteraceae bacterium]|jgi:molybdopterin molybdotransferase|nr:gephyrin-like molybdotransferase Glp [Solirubrobacteraceae bacterium]
MGASQQLEVDDALRIVLAASGGLGSETLALDAALGRVLAEDVHAEQALPPFDSSAMDGFAVRRADLAGAGADTPVALRVIDESRAGLPAAAGLAAGQAIAISTGAIVPVGADAVVPREQARREDGVVRVLERPPAGAHLRHAGEDVPAGARALARGTALGPAQLAMLASLGRARVECARAPRVAVLVTGDELLAPGEPARPGAIRESNSHSLGALARCAGARVAPAVRVPDEPEQTRAAIAGAAADADALVICGGMSVGEHDHVRPALEALGARQLFWGLALRPGHPTWFGTLDGRPVFGLPGNPVSAIVTFVLLAGPALRAMQGAARAGERGSALLEQPYEKPAGRAHALRCSLSLRADGLYARPTGAQGSHVLSSMLAADVLALIPSAVTHVPAGARVEVEPLHPWTAALT